MSPRLRRYTPLSPPTSSIIVFKSKRDRFTTWTNPVPVLNSEVCLEAGFVNGTLPLWKKWSNDGPKSPKIMEQCVQLSFCMNRSLITLPVLLYITKDQSGKNTSENPCDRASAIYRASAIWPNQVSNMTECDFIWSPVILQPILHLWFNNVRSSDRSTNYTVFFFYVSCHLVTLCVNTFKLWTFCDNQFVINLSWAPALTNPIESTGELRMRQLKSRIGAHFRNSYSEQHNSRIEQIPTLLGTLF